MNISLWKGYHSKTLPQYLKNVWDNNGLMLFCPPTLTDFSFVSHLPEGPITCIGTWTPEEQNVILKHERLSPSFPENPVLGLFTSGTSGDGQKLVFYSKKNIEFALRGVMDFFEKENIQHIFCYPHPFHTFGLLLGYMNAQLHGTKLTVLDGRYSSAFHEEWLNTSSKNTLTLGTPTHFKDLLQFLKTRGHKAPQTYSCIVGGAPVSPELWDMLKIELNISKPSLGYGATEASPALTHMPPGQKPFNAGHIGWPLKDVTITPQSQGGFVFEGPNVCLAFLQKGILVFPTAIHLNDELEKNSDGSYTFLGRTDFVLNRGGEKFLLEDIEATLQAQLHIHAMAISVPDNRLGMDLGLLVEIPDHASAPTRESIRACLFEKYKTHFNDTLFFYVPRFPTTESGKWHRRESARILNDLQKAATL